MKPLIALASVALLIATFALWVRKDLLDTDAWTETSAELLADEEVRAAVADFLVDRIDANVNREVASRLDKDLRAKARTALAAPSVRAQWAQANGEAHAGIVALVDGESEAPAVLNLHPVLEEIEPQIGIGPALAAKFPEKVGRLTVLRHDQLEWAQTTARQLQNLAYLLIALALVLYAAAIVVARDHRRDAAGLCALSLLLIGVIVLLVRWLGGAIFDAALDDEIRADGGDRRDLVDLDVPAGDLRVLPHRNRRPGAAGRAGAWALAGLVRQRGPSLRVDRGRRARMDRRRPLRAVVARSGRGPAGERSRCCERARAPQPR